MRLNYLIKGMTYAACVSHVEKAVRRVVNKDDTVTVSLLTNSVSIITGEEVNSGQEMKKRCIRLVISAFFTLTVMYFSMGE